MRAVFAIGGCLAKGLFSLSFSMEIFCDSSLYTAALSTPANAGHDDNYKPRDKRRHNQKKSFTELNIAPEIARKAPRKSTRPDGAVDLSGVRTSDHADWQSDWRSGRGQSPSDRKIIGAS
jgi:hypothetical protein